MQYFYKGIIILIILIVIISVIVSIYLHLAKFGRTPSGERLEVIKQSPNYRDGSFQNLEHTPSLTSGYSMLGIMRDQLFKKTPNKIPSQAIPYIKTNLHELDRSQDILIRFGHSSYFIQIDGKRFLIDPVFSNNASPIPGSVKAFIGADIYNTEDIPDIDYLLITHDHYDHLDYDTIIALEPKIEQVIVGLGVGAHIEHWGYPSTKIIEKDWYEEISLSDDMKIITAPARHFSGRTFKRNNTLRMSYILQTKTKKLYLGGDSGYGSHFQEINHRYGGFDFAILDNGQYNLARQAIHMLPSEVLQAAQDLNTTKLMPVHSSKFALAMHARNEPLSTITQLYQEQNPNFNLVTPMIGQVVYLDDTQQTFEQWRK